MGNDDRDIVLGYALGSALGALERAARELEAGLGSLRKAQVVAEGRIATVEIERVDNYEVSSAGFEDVLYADAAILVTAVGQERHVYRARVRGLYWRVHDRDDHDRSILGAASVGWRVHPDDARRVR